MDNVGQFLSLCLHQHRDGDGYPPVVGCRAADFLMGGTAMLTS